MTARTRWRRSGRDSSCALLRPGCRFRVTIKGDYKYEGTMKGYHIRVLIIRVTIIIIGISFM